VGTILNWSWAFNGVVGAAALLLPLSAAPESQMQAQTGNAAHGTAFSAVAHLNFKIIIPQALSLRVPGADTSVATVTVTRKAVAQDAVCAAPARAAGKAAAGPIVCTASMP
jgi:hypothetical protein